MFVGDTGEDYSGVLPADGDYVVRVYLMRPAARRGESSNYTVTIGASGKALAPIAASKDALVPGYVVSRVREDQMRAGARNDAAGV